MNCRDFERAWNERIDARADAPAGLVGAIEGHAAVCPVCRKLGARYQALSQALDSSTPPPSFLPSPGFADRVLAAAARDDRPFVLRFPRRLAPLAAAAAVVAAVTLGSTWRLQEKIPPAAPPLPVARVRAIDPKDLTDALAVASSATWDLAREASAPAARVGRQVLGPSELATTAPVVSLPGPVRPAAEVWRRVEDRVNAGVRPLEGSARHAFGFLIGEAPDEGQPPPRPAEGA